MASRAAGLQDFDCGRESDFARIFASITDRDDLLHTMISKTRTMKPRTPPPAMPPMLPLSMAVIGAAEIRAAKQSCRRSVRDDIFADVIVVRSIWSQELLSLVKMRVNTQVDWKVVGQKLESCLQWLSPGRIGSLIA